MKLFSGEYYFVMPPSSTDDEWAVYETNGNGIVRCFSTQRDAERAAQEMEKLAKEIS